MEKGDSKCTVVRSRHEPSEPLSQHAEKMVALAIALTIITQVRGDHGNLGHHGNHDHRDDMGQGREQQLRNLALRQPGRPFAARDSGLS